jgi:hypothetical protein
MPSNRHFGNERGPTLAIVSTPCSVGRNVFRISGDRGHVAYDGLVGNACEDAAANGEVGRGTELILRAVISPITFIASLCAFGWLGYWNVRAHNWLWSAFFGVLVVGACINFFVLRRGLLRSVTGKNRR